ncbi:MAG: hypothetical protein WA061_04575 [Microgenomates group bacterium]
MTFKSVRAYALYGLLFLTVVFFLPVLQDMFVLAKWFLVGFIALALIISSIGELIVTKKLTWEKREADSVLALFIFAGVLSLLFGSINKIQALISPQFGLLTFVFLFILYLYVSRAHKKLVQGGMIFGLFSTIFSVTVLFETIPALTALLPIQLKTFQNISLAGNLFDAFLFLGFSAVISLSVLLKKELSSGKRVSAFFGFSSSVFAAIVVLFTLVRNGSALALPSYTHSWYLGVETLKQPLTALFGVGLDNFQTVFTRVKDLAYNSSAVWQISSFPLSRSFIFHVMTEMGLFGLSATLLILVHLFKRAFSEHGTTTMKLVAFYFTVTFILLPPSFLMLFLLFVWVGYVESHSRQHEASLDLGEIIPAYALIALVGIVLMGGSVFLLSRIFMSEYIFKQSLETNNLKNVYEKMKSAVSYNPYNERIRSNFTQIHLLIANTIAEKAPKNEQGQAQLSEVDKQTVSQAIQAAISEAKAVVSLNPQKATNWELLGYIYRNIMGVVQGADSWTISAYQRAVTLDPQNPQYRVALGGVMYGLKQYEDASRLFEQAVLLKPDWSNAQYNYAWSLAQKGEFQRAATAMQACISLLNPAKDSADYTKATADLEEFKKKIPATETSQESTQTTQQQKETLTLPPSAESIIEPKITIPQTASPEAPLR